VLGRGGDVELVIDRTNASGRVVGGHVAMVTGMKKIAPYVWQSRTSTTPFRATASRRAGST